MPNAHGHKTWAAERHRRESIFCTNGAAYALTRTDERLPELGRLRETLLALAGHLTGAGEGCVLVRAAQQRIAERHDTMSRSSIA